MWNGLFLPQDTHALYFYGFCLLDIDVDEWVAPEPIQSLAEVLALHCKVGRFVKYKKK